MSPRADRGLRGRQGRPPARLWALGLALALLVAGVARGKGLVRTVMILPILVPPVAIGSMWKLLYNYDFGVFNQVLVALGLAPANWLGCAKNIWPTSGFAEA